MRKSGILPVCSMAVFVLAGMAVASSDNAATPAVPGGGNPNAKSDNAATPAVPAHKDGGAGGGTSTKYGEGTVPQAHTTPSGVTTAQPGGGNPSSNSPNSATPARKTMGKAGKPVKAVPGQEVFPAPSAGVGISSPPPQPASISPNAGSLYPNGVTQSGPDIPPYVPTTGGGTGETGIIPAGMLTPACLSFKNAALVGGRRFLLIPVPSGDWVSVMNVATGEVVTNLRVGLGPVAVRRAPDGKHAWVACFNANTVAEVDPFDLSVGTPVQVGSRPIALNFNPKGGDLYVANSGDGTVSIVDIKRGVTTSFIRVGGGPQEVLFSPDGKRAFVVNSDASVSVVDTSSRRVVSTIRSR